jgi:hypothetical protein
VGNYVSVKAFVLQISMSCIRGLNRDYDGVPTGAESCYGPCLIPDSHPSHVASGPSDSDSFATLVLYNGLHPVPNAPLVSFLQHKGGDLKKTRCMWQPSITPVRERSTG